MRSSNCVPKLNHNAIVASNPTVGNLHFCPCGILNHSTSEPKGSSHVVKSFLCALRHPSVWPVPLPGPPLAGLQLNAFGMAAIEVFWSETVTGLTGFQWLVAIFNYKMQDIPISRVVPSLKGFARAETTKYSKGFISSQLCDSQSLENCWMCIQMPHWRFPCKASPTGPPRQGHQSSIFTWSALKPKIVRGVATGQDQATSRPLGGETYMVDLTGLQWFGGPVFPCHRKKRQLWWSSLRGLGIPIFRWSIPKKKHSTSKKPPHFKPHCTVRPLMVPGLVGRC